MTKRETTSLLVKLMGVYCLVQFAPSLLYVFGYIAQIQGMLVWWHGLLMLIFSFVVPAVWIAICIAVIRSSDRIARWLIREDAEATQLTALGFRDVQTLGYNFIGLLLIVQTLPQVIQILSAVRMQQSIAPGSPRQGFLMHTLPKLLAFLTQFLIGLFLFLKAKGLANIWHRLQETRPMKRTPDNKASEDIDAGAPNPQR